MNKIEIVRIYQLLSGAKFDKVTNKDERFALYDMVFAMSKVFGEYVNIERQSADTIKNEKERLEYMEKIALSDSGLELPNITKDTVYELVDSNREHLTLGSINLLGKLVKE